ncbi:MAG: HD domain-containing protein [Planctomycetota bacterium]|nr:HD domain-containing protein [Planctomycetota bacterium]
MHLSDAASHGELRLSEIISALSYALDIVEGQPEGHAVRSCMLGMRLGQELDLPTDQLSSLFYALLLKDLGCSSNASKVCYLFGADDLDVKRDFKTTYWTRQFDTLRYIARNVAPTGSLLDRLKHLSKLAISGHEGAKELIKIRCERGANIARTLLMTDETVQGIRNLDEHWNGQGHPDGLKKHDIPLIARILSISQTFEVFYSKHGIEAAYDVADARSGRWFDPGLVRALHSIRGDSAFWAKLADDVPRRHLDSFEPQDKRLSAGEAMLDRIASGFGQVIDAKSPWTACHSKGVSDVAVGICEVMGLPRQELVRVRRAGLLHDIGKLGISNLILDKPGKLTVEEFDTMKLHPAYTARILERVEVFKDFAELAASHHERLDGKGYYRGLDASQMSTSARSLVVADMYEALAAKRPYRKDLSDGEVMEILAKNVANGGLCPAAFEALKVFIARSGFVPFQVAA